jgi:hypothetical protein
MPNPYPDSLIGKTSGGQARFFSSSDAVMYINNLKVPSAVTFSWNMQEMRIPLYGYNDKLYRTVTNGRVQISGVFEVNFLYKGLVELLMLSESSERTKALVDLIGSDQYYGAAIKTQIERGKVKPLDQMNEGDLIAFITDVIKDPNISNKESIERLSKVNRFLEGKFYTHPPKVVEGTQITKNPYRIDIFYSNHNKIDPSLGSGQLARVNILSESFIECYTTGRSKTVRAEVGGPDGGGSPILEVYQFVARKLE